MAGRRRACVLALAAAALAGWAACGDSGAFACVEDSQCVVAGNTGTCQSNGACSFPDLECVSGQRYGDHVGGSFAGMCVPIDEETSGSAGMGGSTGASLPGDDESAGPATTLAVDDSDADTVAGTTAPVSGTSSTGSVPDDGSSTGEPTPAVTLQFGERDDADVSSVTLDTYVALTTPDYNGGAHADLHVVQESMPAAALIAFDLSAIPPGSEVVDATLELWTEASGYLLAGEVQMRRMIEPWDEGDADHDVGIPNWTERTADDPWTTAGAEAPGSSESTVLGTLDADMPRQAYTVDVPADIVQEWVDTPSENFGLRLAAVDFGEDYAWYLSSEHGDAARRPALFVTFVPPAP